jgi:hypothetical protein
VILTLILAALLVSPQLMGQHGSENGPPLPSNYQPCYSGSDTCN